MSRPEGRLLFSGEVLEDLGSGVVVACAAGEDWRHEVEGGDACGQECVYRLNRNVCGGDIAGDGVSHRLRYGAE